MPIALAVLLDVLLVFVFATIGRGSHAEALTPAGIATVAAPFLAGLLMGWVLLILRGFLTRPLAQGAFLVGMTVVFGMLFRTMLGGGVQPSFVAVATIALAVLLLGWRAIAQLVLRGRTTTR